MNTNGLAKWFDQLMKHDLNLLRLYGTKKVHSYWCEMAFLCFYFIFSLDFG